jgi:hypothetical protein
MFMKCKDKHGKTKHLASKINNVCGETVDKLCTYML